MPLCSTHHFLIFFLCCVSNFPQNHPTFTIKVIIQMWKRTTCYWLEWERLHFEVAQFCIHELLSVTADYIIVITICSLWCQKHAHVYRDRSYQFKWICHLMEIPTSTGNVVHVCAPLHLCVWVSGITKVWG